MKATELFPILIYFYISRLKNVNCIRITKVDVDTPIISGEGGWLKCDWNGEGDTLYSIKWYWGTNEFYRWSPKAEKPLLVFEVDAFEVDQTKSEKGHVFLKDVSLKATGILRCEVSGEGPTFHTDHDEVKLLVVDLPDSRPIISGARTVYQLHQDVALTCSSPWSKPAAALAFYINDVKADPSWLIPQPPEIDPETRLETAVLGIRFQLRPRLLHNGKVKVKCVAEIFDVYWESAVEYIAADLPQRASRMEERASSLAAAQSLLTNLQILKGIGFLQLFIYASLYHRLRWL